MVWNKKRYEIKKGNDLLPFLLGSGSPYWRATTAADFFARGLRAFFFGCSA